MKRILLIILLTCVLITLWVYGLLGRYNYLTAHFDIMTNKPKIVYTGISDVKLSDINKVSEKFGFNIIHYKSNINLSNKNGIDSYNAVMNKYLDEINNSGWEKLFKEKIQEVVQLEKLHKEGFWIKQDNSGYWYHVEWVHNHRNNAKIGIYNKEGKLVVKGGFMMICNNDSFTLIEDLEQQIVYFDGKKIQIKNSSCYLMK